MVSPTSCQGLPRLIGDCDTAVAEGLESYLLGLSGPAPLNRGLRLNGTDREITFALGLSGPAPLNRGLRPLISSTT